MWEGGQECQEVRNLRRQPWHWILRIGIDIYLNSLKKTTDVFRHDTQRWAKIRRGYFWIAQSIALKPLWLRLRSFAVEVTPSNKSTHTAYYHHHHHHHHHQHQWERWEMQENLSEKIIWRPPCTWHNKSKMTLKSTGTIRLHLTG